MSKVLSVVHNDCFWNFCPKSISTNRNFRYQRIKAQKKGQRAKFQKLINKSTQPDLIKLAWVKYFDGPCITIYSLFTIYSDIHYQLFLISYSLVHKIEICLKYFLEKKSQKAVIVGSNIMFWERCPKTLGKVLRSPFT